MKEKRRQLRKKKIEKQQQEGQRQQRRDPHVPDTDIHKSATDLLNSPNNSTIDSHGNSPPKYIEKQMNATFVDPPSMPRPNVAAYSNTTNVQNNIKDKNFDFKSKSSLRQALWIDRSAIAKYSDDSQDIDVGFGRNNNSKKNEGSKMKKKK